MNLRQGRLRRKIIAWSFIPTALILLAVALVNFGAYNQVTQELVMLRSRETARQTAANIADELDASRHQLESIARALSAYPDDPAAQQAILAENNELQITFGGGLIALDSVGNLVAADPERPLGSTINWSRTSLFYLTSRLQSEQSVTTDLEPIGSQGEALLALGVPIRDAQGAFLGVAAGLIEVNNQGARSLHSRMSGLTHAAAENGTFTLVDGRGRVLYSTLGIAPQTDRSQDALVRLVTNGAEGALRSLDAEGQDRVASYARVPGSRWGLIYEEPWNSLTRTTQAYRFFLIALLAAGVVVPAAVVLLGVRRLMRPISELTEAAQQVAGGQFGHTIQARTGDEIEDLTEQFNRMSAQLAESVGLLESRVAARTHDLATLNAVAETVSRTVNVQTVLERVLEITIVSTGADAGLVALRRDGGLPVLTACRGLPPELARTLAEDPFPVDRPSTRLLSQAQPGPGLEGLLEHGYASESLIPLIFQDNQLGVLRLWSYERRLLGQERLELLVSIGNQIGVAVENARLYQQAEAAAAAAERSRLARELHDAVTQILFSASLIADVLPRIWERDPAEARRRLEELRALNRGALAEMRTLLLELRPSALVEADPNELFRHLADAFTGRTRLPVDLRIHDGHPLDPDVKVALYRIAQEALNNVGKHAHASQVALELDSRPGQVTLRVRDNGVGFEPGSASSDHLGLSIMRERAGNLGIHLSVQSAPGQGTIIEARYLPQAGGTFAHRESSEG